MKLSQAQTLWLIVIIKFVLPYILQDHSYQLHRDEYLYLSEGHHLAWGYLEVPPLLSVFAWLSNTLGATSFWVKLWPNLFGCFTILLIGKMVIRLGGKNFALWTASLPFLIGGYLRLFYLLHPNFLDVFFWTLMAFGIFQFIEKKKESWLYVFGLAVGLGLLSKYSAAFYAASLLAGLAISRHRKVFANKHLYYAGLLAFVIFLPNILWQYSHNFPIIFHMEELQEEQLQFISSMSFLKGQLMMLLAFVFIWISGILFVIFSKRGRSLRVFAWAYAIVIGLLFALHGKDYYALGAYPVLFALGGFYLEKITSKKARWTRIFIIGLPVALSLFALPLVLPIFKPLKLASYYKNTGLDKSGALKWEDQQTHELPQDFADMIGWKEMTILLAKKFQELPAETQRHTMIYARGYYTAGALNYYGKKLGLPEVYSDNASFLFWMPEKYNLKSLLLVGHRFPEKDDAVFQQFERSRLLDSVNMPLFRENGMKFYLFENANDSANLFIEKSVSNLRGKFERH